MLQSVQRQRKGRNISTSQWWPPNSDTKQNGPGPLRPGLGWEPQPLQSQHFGLHFSVEELETQGGYQPIPKEWDSGLSGTGIPYLLLLQELSIQWERKLHTQMDTPEIKVPFTVLRLVERVVTKLKGSRETTDHFWMDGQQNCFFIEKISHG